jgi:hypothetical protein
MGERDTPGDEIHRQWIVHEILRQASSGGDTVTTENSEVPEYYASSVAMATSIYDVTLQFRVQVPPLTPGQPPAERPVCVVRMSPQHAKMLGLILTNAIRDYEARFQIRLPIPPDRQAEFGDADADVS